jgi:Tfp pilus assembly protein PilW
MLSRWRRLRARRAGDEGITMMELVVAMSLMSIVGAMALTFFVGSTRATTRTSDDSTTTANGRTTLAIMAQALRLADTPTANAGYATARFTTITANSVVFYSNINADRTGSTSRSAPTKVAFTASGTALTEQTWAPLTQYPSSYTTNYAATPTSSTVLLTDLAATSVFSYYTSTLNATTGTFTTATTTTSVASVAMSLTLTGLTGEANQTVTSTVGITGAFS